VASVVKLTVSLPKDLAREARQIAKNEGRSVSSVIQEALRAARAQRAVSEYREIQGFWSRRAREKRILTERDLNRYLRE
jgi:Arc/MetJ-type ribon-helix-helix transcriptional regulator